MKRSTANRWISWALGMLLAFSLLQSSKWMMAYGIIVSVVALIGHRNNVVADILNKEK